MSDDEGEDSKEVVEISLVVVGMCSSMGVAGISPVVVVNCSSMVVVGT